MTVADLWKQHESRPRNQLVANAFFLIKYVEGFGTGIRQRQAVNDLNKLVACPYFFPGNRNGDPTGRAENCLAPCPGTVRGNVRR